MLSTASEMAEMWEYEELYDQRQKEVERTFFLLAIEHYSGMDAQRALDAYADAMENTDFWRREWMK